jgi:uncharacterized protein (DUF1330 family)
MNKGYWIVAYRSVSDCSAVTAYTSEAIPAISRSGGRFVVRAHPTKVEEYGLSRQLAAVIEFPSIDAAINAYDSKAYQRACGLLAGVAERDFRIVEGLE